MQLLTLAQLRAIEEQALIRDEDLVALAGSASASWLANNFDKKSRILVVVGRGNNGADGISCAIELIKLGYKVDLVRLFKDSTEVNQKWLSQFTESKRALIRLPADMSKYNVIVDAIYGIGLTHEIDVETAGIVQKLNNHNGFMVSLDSPSGLNPFSGRVLGDAIYADATLTFISDKPGLHTGDGLDFSGDIHVIDLVKLTDYSVPSSMNVIKFNQMSDVNYDDLVRTRFNTNKGSYGTVAIIGGNKGMVGALCLAGRAALRSGAGKVVLAPLDKGFLFDPANPELMVQTPKQVLQNLQAFDAIAIGPGLGKDKKAIEILNKLLGTIEDSKLLIDADALNLIAEDATLKNKFREVRYKILTPHPGEAARILGVTVNEIQDNRFNALVDIADLLHGVVILKGAGTLIYNDNQIYINVTGNPALANAGQGDTLTGIILGFLAQNVSPIDATRLGVFIHGLAGDRLMIKNKGYNGVSASIVAEEVCNVINELIYGELFN